MTSTVAAPAPRFAVPERLEATAFAGFDSTAQLTDWSGATMGTRWSVRAVLPVGQDATRVEALIRRRLDGLVAEMSHWDGSSLLSRFNEAPAGSWTDLPPDFAAVIAASLEVAEQSGGLFDPALGRITDSWGLGAHPTADPPTESTLAIAREASGWRRLRFEREPARLYQPGGLWLDLSGIAKGHAADAVADTLAGIGILHALVEVGGEFTGRGLRPDSDPWWVELEAPAELDIAPLRVALHQLAVATSGDYLRGAHTIDPTTGRVAFDGATAVSVIHRSCMLADAWASVFAIVPEAEARRLADRRGLAVRAITRDGREWLSTLMQDMLGD